MSERVNGAENDCIETFKTVTVAVRTIRRKSRTGHLEER